MGVVICEIISILVPFHRELKGMKALRNESVTVIFHALVSTDDWQLEEKSPIHIEFGHRDLGDWHADCGEVTHSR